MKTMHASSIGPKCKNSYVPMKNALISVFRFYLDGFREMKLGKTLWLIILVKLFIMFIVLKIFFFPDFLGSRFQTSEEKAEFVGKQLIERTINP